MSNSYTVPVAIKRAHEESILSPDNMGTCVVHGGGPSVNVYRDLEDRTRLDIIGAGMFYIGVTLEYAQTLFI